MIVLGAVLLLGACGEHPQTTLALHRKDDAPAYKGAEGDPLAAKNWTPSDRTNWENQIRVCD